MTRLAYVGWNGRGNTGDDAIYDAVSEAVAPVATVDPFPVFTRDLARAWRGWRDAHLLLGGGTLVGRSVWRQTLRYKASPLVKQQPWFMLGAGVEDPSFQGRHSYSGGGRELRRWPSLLGRFHRVTVRGPRSQELLADVGVASEVVGDPALLLEGAGGSPAAAGVVGVTLGYGSDLWGHDHERVEAAVLGCVRRLRYRGWRVRLIAMNRDDAEFHGRLASGVPVETAATPEAYVRAAGECDVMVAERLHAMVLSAAAGTPFVGLEYQPKCADFARSVGWEPWMVRTDRVVEATLCEQVESVGAARGGLVARVEELRRRLRDEAAEIRRAVA